MKTRLALNSPAILLPLFPVYTITPGSDLFFKVDIGVPNSSPHVWSASAFFTHPKTSPQPTPLSVCIVEYSFERDMATGILKSEQLYLPSQDQSDNLGETQNVRLTCVSAPSPARFPNWSVVWGSTTVLKVRVSWEEGTFGEVATLAGVGVGGNAAFWGLPMDF